MNSVCRPGPSHVATLMDGFPCPINSGPLACFLCVSWVQGWLFSGTAQRNYSTLLTRLFGKKKKISKKPTLHPVLKRRNMFTLRWPQRQWPFPLRGVLCILIFFLHNYLRSQQKLLCRFSWAAFFCCCLEVKKQFSLQTLEGKEVTVALYYS